MKIQQFLTQLSEHCGVSPDAINIEMTETDEQISIHLIVPDEDSGIFIGHHGDVIDALQRIVRVIFQDSESESNKKITLNINYYREKRLEKLTELTRNIAQKVSDTGRPYEFRSYLPAHERFIVHSTLADMDDFSHLESISEGFGRDRKLVIRVK